LAYSTFFGGNRGWGIAVSPDGKAFVAGQVLDSIPTRDAIQNDNLGRGDAFIALIEPAGLGLEGDLRFATYLGGTGTDVAGAIASDGVGNAYVAGTTWSEDFPTTLEAFQPDLSVAQPEKKKG
jgi:hypothetical protein